MIAAWVIVTALGSSTPIIEKQIRVEPRACHLPLLRGEYPVSGEWRAVMIKIVCKR
jgi:hypothetical protein